MRGFLLGLSILATIALGGAGLYSFFSPPEDAPAFLVAETERDLGSHPVGKSLLVYEITNRSTVPRRILGLEEG
jgi:hypothetical protein